MAKLFSAAALTLALASFGCRAAPSNCGACCPSGGVASQPTYAADETATAQAETDRRYSYSPNGSTQAGGRSASATRQTPPSYNNAWRADRKVVGF